jgi:5-hydroxyisourate hydrolase
METALGRLSTHVLDLAAGRPAGGLALTLYCLTDGQRIKLAETRTNADGRVDKPLLEGEALRKGTYELVFQAGRYFDAQGLGLPSHKFLDEVAIRFGVADADEHYHVPLLLSPYGYSTYRGS